MEGGKYCLTSSLLYHQNAVGGREGVEGEGGRRKGMSEKEREGMSEREREREGGR